MRNALSSNPVVIPLNRYSFFRNRVDFDTQTIAFLKIEFRVAVFLLHAHQILHELSRNVMRTFEKIVGRAIDGAAYHDIQPSSSMLSARCATSASNVGRLPGCLVSSGLPARALPSVGDTLVCSPSCFAVTTGRRSRTSAPPCSRVRSSTLSASIACHLVARYQCPRGGPRSVIPA